MARSLGGEVLFCCPICGPTTTDQCLAVGTAEDLSLVALFSGWRQRAAR